MQKRYRQPRYLFFCILPRPDLHPTSPPKNVSAATIRPITAALAPQPRFRVEALASPAAPQPPPPRASHPTCRTSPCLVPCRGFSLAHHSTATAARAPHPTYSPSPCLVPCRGFSLAHHSTATAPGVPRTPIISSPVRRAQRGVRGASSPHSWASGATPIYITLLIRPQPTLF